MLNKMKIYKLVSSRQYKAIQITKENEETLFKIFPNYTVRYNLLNPKQYGEVPKYGNEEIGYTFELRCLDYTLVGTIFVLFNNWIVFKKGKFKEVVSDNKFKRKYELK